MLLLRNKFRAEKHMGENRRKKKWQKTANKIRRAALCHTFILFGGSKTTTISSNSSYSSSSNNNFEGGQIWLGHPL